MVYAQDFTYNGTSLSDISEDLVIVSFEDSVHNSNVGVVDRTVNRSDITYNDAIAHDYGAIDNGVYRLKITICNQYSNYLSPEIIRQLSAWLLSPVEPRWLSFTAYEPLAGSRAQTPVYDGVFFKGRFVSSSYDDMGGINKMAISFDFENISPYGFTALQTYEISSSSTVTEVIETPGTDVGKEISPIIVIESHADQTVEILNEAGNTASFSIDIPNNTSIVIADDNCFY